MAILSKINRDGVDVVIEQLQQYTFPNLLGFWEAGITYTSYPRANKTYRKDDILPIVALDKKDYRNVLKDDKVEVNSFFLADDNRVYNEETRQFKQNISIIFQCDLVKLYAQTNRADEEFNMDIMRVLRKENLYIVGDITMTEGIDAVYSALTITGELKNIVNKTDTSQFHVLKVSFDVLYREDCVKNITKVCTPATETVNTVAVSPIPSGSSKAIIVQNDLPSPVQVGNILVDTPTSLIISVPSAVPVIIVSTSPSTSGQEQTYDPINLGDEGARFLAGDFASVDYADITDIFTLLLDNEFGNKQRITGDTGGFMDFSTGLFFDKDGIATIKALAFPNDILRDYAFRRRWYFFRSGARSWQASMDAIQTESRGGEIGWFVPTQAEYEMLSNNNLTNNSSTTFIDSRLFNWSAFTMWSGTTTKTNIVNAYRYNSGIDVFSIAAKTQSNGNAFVKLF